MEENNRDQGGQNTQSGQQPKTGLSWSQPTNMAGGPAPQNNKPPMQQQKPIQSLQQKSNKKTMGIVIALVVVAGLAVWAFNAKRENTAPASEPVASSTLTTTTGQETTTEPVSIQAVVAPVTVAGGGAPTVASPQDAGLQVAVSSISVSVPTWVIIYENHNGQPGNALGASLFTAGKTSGVVDLLRGTLPGQMYIAGEEQDDGDHIFSLQNDPAVRDTQGNPVWVQFKTR